MVVTEEDGMNKERGRKDGEGWKDEEDGEGEGNEEEEEEDDDDGDDDDEWTCRHSEVAME